MLTKTGRWGVFVSIIRCSGNASRFTNLEVFMQVIELFFSVCFVAVVMYQAGLIAAVLMKSISLDEFHRRSYMPLLRDLPEYTILKRPTWTSLKVTLLTVCPWALFVSEYEQSMSLVAHYGLLFVMYSVMYFGVRVYLRRTSAMYRDLEDIIAEHYS